MLSEERATTRIRHGCHRVHMLRRRKGWHSNAKRAYRLYKELILQIHYKTQKRRAKLRINIAEGWTEEGRNSRLVAIDSTAKSAFA